MKKYFGLALVCIVSVLVMCGCASSNYLKTFSKDVNNYTINAVLNVDEHMLNCEQTTKYINNTDTTLSEIYFHLYPKSFKDTAVNKPVSSLYETKAYPNGFSGGDLIVNQLKVNDVESEIIYEGVDKTLLKVELSTDLFPDEYVEIDFQYDITLPNVNHRFGYGENTINLGNFYPVACVYDNGFDKNEYHYNGDPFYSDVANYEIEIKHDSDLTVACTGEIVNQIETYSLTTTKMSAKAVRDFAVVLSEKFKVISCFINNTEIKYYYYLDEKSEDSLNTAVLSIKTFSDLFGEYPYATLSVVESNFVHGGMEFPTLVLISDALDNYEDYTQTIVHEIAHQWWYGLVGNNQYEYGYLDEGLAEYSTALFFEQNEDYGIKKSEIIKNAESSYCLFVDVYTDVFGKVDTTMNRSLDEYATEPEYVYLAYVKGMLMFDSLRELIGDKAFYKSLQKYYLNYRGKNATPEDMINMFEKTSLTDLESFFKSWINGKVIIKDMQTNG